MLIAVRSGTAGTGIGNADRAPGTHQQARCEHTNTCNEAQMRQNHHLPPANEAPYLGENPSANLTVAFWRNSAQHKAIKIAVTMTIRYWRTGPRISYVNRVTCSALSPSARSPAVAPAKDYHGRALVSIAAITPTPGSAENLGHGVRCVDCLRTTDQGRATTA